ncbi:hypothetical protein D3C75_986810 [compost metagenome]
MLLDQVGCCNGLVLELGGVRRQEAAVHHLTLEFHGDQAAPAGIRAFAHHQVEIQAAGGTQAVGEVVVKVVADVRDGVVNDKALHLVFSTRPGAGGHPCHQQQAQAQRSQAFHGVSPGPAFVCTPRALSVKACSATNCQSL